MSHTAMPSAALSSIPRQMRGFVFVRGAAAARSIETNCNAHSMHLQMLSVETRAFVRISEPFVIGSGGKQFAQHVRSIERLLMCRPYAHANEIGSMDTLSDRNKETGQHGTLDPRTASRDDTNKPTGGSLPQGRVARQGRLPRRRRHHADVWLGDPSQHVPRFHVLGSAGQKDVALKRASMYESTHPQISIAGDRSVFPVEDDDTLGRLIALFLHSRLFGGKAPRGTTSSLKALGWEDSLVDEMSTMHIDDVARILSGSNACLGVVFDHRKAAAVVNSYRAIKRDEHDLDYFILNGATPALIRQLFPTIGARLVAQRRKLLGCESRGGRPPLPDAETSYAIYRCWKSLCEQQLSARDRYRRLKEAHPTLSLATLCAAIESN
jgi:hypothetical protein